MIIMCGLSGCSAGDQRASSVRSFPRAQDLAAPFGLAQTPSHETEETQPASSRIEPTEGAPEFDEYQPNADDDARITHLVERAHNMLMRGEPEAAVEILTEAQTIRNWAQSRKAASVLFWLGQSYERLDEHAGALSAYRRVVIQYPNSAWSNRARKRITALQSIGAGEHSVLVL